MKIFGLPGWSGSGKTTLLVKLIPELVCCGRRSRPGIRAIISLPVTATPRAANGRLRSPTGLWGDSLLH